MDCYALDKLIDWPIVFLVDQLNDWSDCLFVVTTMHWTEWLISWLMNGMSFLQYLLIEANMHLIECFFYSPADGSRHDAPVQGDHQELPADSLQVSLCVQPAWLCACDQRRAACALHSHARDRQGQAHQALDTWGLQGLLWQAHWRTRQVTMVTLVHDR